MYCDYRVINLERLNGLNLNQLILSLLRTLFWFTVFVFVSSIFFWCVFTLFTWEMHNLLKSTDAGNLISSFLRLHSSFDFQLYIQAQDFHGLPLQQFKQESLCSCGTLVVCFLHECWLFINWVAFIFSNFIIKE
jgi:hypothetical protein